MELWQLYLIEVLPNISGGCVALTLILGTIAAMLFLVIVTVPEEDFRHPHIRKRINKTFRNLIIATCITGTIAIFTPSRQGIYRIAGGYIITNIQGVEKLPPKMLSAAESWLNSITPTEKEPAS